ncbi:ABC-2 type transport system ATP-binding protein [Neorhodopirellula lusitana]|uniref:ABC-2 type transport system ATP-binding protein n=1 Tax=Neorhodopirellula lusitana TaxID=445327 RepID=A0ABY1Q977_9BACT|nr:ATP-binding cassette domain-containing protein [Neorhodopirellula lusitana]SMP61601.1 ABC-2 type transport system ATP-binding protein [Neorhodopirellula lusitana]
MGETTMVSSQDVDDLANVPQPGHATAESAADPATIPPIVQVKNFHKSYGRQVAVDGIDLEIHRGEIYGLIGPDGAGKSSLMKAVAGVLTYDSGSVDVFGVRVDSERSAEIIKDRIGLMPQGLGLNLYADLSIEENVDFFGQIRLVPKDVLRQRKQRLLEMTRLDKFRSRPMKNLSGGMKQKLGLVCCLIHHPKLVILDEPTTGVDPVSRRDFWSILAKLLREEQITALVSTAYMDEATRFHHAALMFDGKCLARGEPDEIAALVPGRIVQAKAESQATALAKLKATFPQSEAVGPWLRVFVDDADDAEASDAVTTQIADCQPSEVHVAQPDLEDVFIALLRRRGLTDEGDSVSLAQSNLPPATTADGLAIEAHDLVRQFGQFRAVDGVSFQVAPGEIFGLLGANGAGKTTVIKMLTGLMPPTSGTGRVAGADMRRASQSIKERIGYMSQSFSLYQDLTVVENIRLYAGIYGLSRREASVRTDWIIDMAGLSGREKHLSGSLPMGVRQRLAIGCALVHRPQVLFLDEPTSGVDPIGRRRLWDIIFELSRNEGVAILVTTHYMSEAEHCDHIAMMYAGRVFADASPTQLKANLRKESGQLLEVSTDNPLAALDILESSGFDGVSLFGKRIHFLAPDLTEAESRVRKTLDSKNIQVLSVSEQPITMEDVFVNRVLALEKLDEKNSASPKPDEENADEATSDKAKSNEAKPKEAKS